MEKNEKVKLVLINERALTFKADDYLKLRTEHRIVGKLMGACVPYPRNVSVNGLPAYYTEYQTRFMLEMGIAELENKKGLIKPPTAEMKKAFEAHQDQLISEAQDPYVETKLEAVRSNMDNIIKGKTAKLLRKGVKQEDIKINADDILKQEEQRLRSTMKTTIAYSQIPTQHPFHLSSNLVKEFPVDNMSKYKVFHDLWHKGFYITNGESFGGDFLTYHDDPMYFHASQIVHVIDESEKFELYFPISCTRLAVSVKKKCVFAYLNEDGQVIYQTMIWDNPKLKEIYAVEKGKKRIRVMPKEEDSFDVETQNGENSKRCKNDDKVDDEL